MHYWVSRAGRFGGEVPRPSIRFLRFAGTGLVASGAALVLYTGTLFAQTVAPPHPPTPPAPLSSIAVPGPSDTVLGQYIKLDKKSELVALGKAFFWDMQTGGDGVQACASCHFHAGADNRQTNTVNPKGDGFQVVSGPGQTLTSANFPITSNDVVGSQGLHKMQFAAVTPGGSVDTCQPLADSVFASERQVTGRNTPSVVNAAFNFRNFWDGRANNNFNGVSPFGARDPNARVYRHDPSGMLEVQVLIPFSSLASQSVGPPTSGVEMSCDGRQFPHIGMKLLRPRNQALGQGPLQPLGYQNVAVDDSVLAPYRHPSGTGLNKSYPDFIMDVFQPQWWDGPGFVNIPGLGNFTQMEANFSLFWGLAIQAYEETLIANNTPFDRYLATGTDPKFGAAEQAGYAIFMGKGRCINCHGGPELTNASVSNVQNQRLERMVLGHNEIGVYDNGFYNIGVRPTADDPGVGGTDPFNNPLSETKLCQQNLANCPPEIKSIQARSDVLNGVAITIPAGDLLPPCQGTQVYTLTNPVCDQPAVMGSFKTPGLRDVALTGPYWHNGGFQTLEQVVDFYDRGGDFPQNPDLDVNIAPIGLTAVEKANLVAFLNALTDERVVAESAPFDHPQLCVAHAVDGSASGTDLPTPGTGTCSAAVGAGGHGATQFEQPFLQPELLFTGNFAGILTAVLALSTAATTLFNSIDAGGVLPVATPELDSILLFGSGALGMAGYALTRRRARNGKRRKP